MVCLLPLKFREGFTVPVLASVDRDGGGGATLLLFCILFIPPSSVQVESFYIAPINHKMNLLTLNMQSRSIESLVDIMH